MMNTQARGTWFPFRAPVRPPLEPDLAKVFDHLQSPDIRTAPHRLVAPFGARERTVGDPEALFANIAKDKNNPCGRTAPVGDWLNMVDALKPFGAKGQVAGVNRYVNQMTSIHEIAEFGKSRAWAAPVTHFRCRDSSEEYAFAKYLSLRVLGFHAERLRLVWLKRKGGADHAVLTVQLGGREFVLDNTHDAILPADAVVSDFQPYCSLNGFRFCVHWPQTAQNGAKRALRMMRRQLKRSRLAPTLRL